MKLSHFETLRPVCPRCRTDLKRDSDLTIGQVRAKTEQTIVEGTLVCTAADCLSEYPIIDGIPLLVPNLRHYVQHQADAIFARDDLSDTSQSILGDCLGAGSAYDVQRQHLSTYAFDHYGDLDPAKPAGAGYTTRLLHQGLDAAPPWPNGPSLDIGCAVGRTTFELAHARGAPVLGIDLNFDMLKTASRILHQGVVRYPRRRVGVVYDMRDYAASFEAAPWVDFWACDGLHLPFRSETIAGVTSLNLIDCVASPHDHLREVERILTPQGVAILGTPYDWSPSSTPIEAWVGGHSQRGESGGAAEPMMRSLFAGGAHPMALKRLTLTQEFESAPWQVRNHDRSTTHYQVHLMVAQANG